MSPLHNDFNFSTNKYLIFEANLIINLHIVAAGIADSFLTRPDAWQTSFSLLINFKILTSSEVEEDTFKSFFQGQRLNICLNAVGDFKAPSVFIVVSSHHPK
jgi:hypothetical protein